MNNIISMTLGRTQSFFQYNKFNDVFDFIDEQYFDIFTIDFVDAMYLSIFVEFVDNVETSLEMSASCFIDNYIFSSF